MAITAATSLPLAFRAAQGWVASAVSSGGGGGGGGGAGGDASQSSGAVHLMGRSGHFSGQSEECVEDKRGEHDVENANSDLELVALMPNGHNGHERVSGDLKSACSRSQENCHGCGERSTSSSWKKGERCCPRIGNGYGTYVYRSIVELCCGTKLCWLLPLVPVTLVAEHLDAGKGLIFVGSLLAIAPLAERLGFVTEQLSFFTGPTIGGLLNATFGNATEMIISVLALRQNMIRVVQLSLLGSILSNMLLVLGCAFFFGGLTHPKKDQKFNKPAALVSSGLLLMAVMGLLFPAVLHATHTEAYDGTSELTLSRFSSCVMLVAYACYLYFQLKSHRQLYDPEDEESEEDKEDGEREEEEQVLGRWGSIFWLGVLTILISILSDCLVDAIKGASDMWNIPVAFISVVILPIVGNAAEHASAVMFALKDKLDISLGVAIGSSTQISMFVIPFCVVVGWMTGKNMDLDFHLFETATLFSTVLVVAALLQEGTANYFKGLMLVFCYLIVSASYWVHEDDNYSRDAAPPGGGT